MSKQSLISTTQLAKRKNLPTKDLFAFFSNAGFIERTEDKWQLTEAGAEAGGEYRTSQKHGDYIVWPDVIELPGENSATKSALTAKDLGKHFEISARKFNLILSELGWIEKALKGWKVTTPGKRVGGVQKENFKNGVPYVSWPESISSNSTLIATIHESLGKASPEVEVKKETNNFRDVFPANLRCQDGHLVRSRAEMLIDNWLYMEGIAHAYERKLPVEEEMYCDFYIPSGKVYIEFWGMENDPKYMKRKKTKLEIYNKYDFNLIELTDSDIENLDDSLPKLLLKYNVQTY